MWMQQYFMWWVWYAILKCAQKLVRASLIYYVQPKIKTKDKEETENKNGSLGRNSYH